MSNPEMSEPIAWEPQDLYSLPASWKWVALKEIAFHKSGIAFKSKDFIEDGIQVVRLGNVYKGTLDLTRDPTFLPKAYLEENFTLYSGTIIVSQTGTRNKRDYGNFVLIPRDYPPLLLNQRLLAVFCIDNISPEYIFLSSRIDAYKNHFFSHETGGVNQGNVGIKGIMDGPIPLPPLNEQRRIVEKIEALSAHSRNARQALDAIPALLDQFRQSVLAAAFRGDLTADWRAQHPDVEPASALLERIRTERRQRWEAAELEKMRAKGKEPKDDKWKAKYKEPEAVENNDLPAIPISWIYSTFSQISERVTVGHVGSMKDEYLSEGIPFLRSQNVRENRFEPEGLQYISQEFHQKLSKSSLQPGDLVVVRSGNVGVTCVIPDSLYDANCSDLVVVKQPSGITPEFGSFYMNSVAKSQVTEQQVGVALTHFNTKSMATLPVPVAPLEEQLEIVKQIEHDFKIIESIEKIYVSSAREISQLDQSILAKAFRGQLVPQDPTDEPASHLLARIRTERQTTAKTTQKTKRKPTA